MDTNTNLAHKNALFNGQGPYLTDLVKAGAIALGFNAAYGLRQTWFPCELVIAGEALMISSPLLDSNATLDHIAAYPLVSDWIDEDGNVVGVNVRWGVAVVRDGKETTLLPYATTREAAKKICLILAELCLSDTFGEV
jgi:hypothetical protein